MIIREVTSTIKGPVIRSQGASCSAESVKLGFPMEDRGQIIPKWRQITKHRRGKRQIWDDVCMRQSSIHLGKDKSSLFEIPSPSNHDWKYFNVYFVWHAFMNGRVLLIKWSYGISIRCVNKGKANRNPPSSIWGVLGVNLHGINLNIASGAALFCVYRTVASLSLSVIY